LGLGVQIPDDVPVLFGGPVWAAHYEDRDVVRGPAKRIDLLGGDVSPAVLVGQSESFIWAAPMGSIGLYGPAVKVASASVLSISWARRPDRRTSTA
jgi:hypothetical protein